MIIGYPYFENLFLNCSKLRKEYALSPIKGLLKLNEVKLLLHRNGSFEVVYSYNGNLITNQ